MTDWWTLYCFDKRDNRSLIQSILVFKNYIIIYVDKVDDYL